jgi:hypothetical protein
MGGLGEDLKMLGDSGSESVSEPGIGDSDPDPNTKKIKAGQFRYDSENNIAGPDTVPISS